MRARFFIFAILAFGTSFTFAETPLQPLTIECTIFAQNFPGVKDHLGQKEKRVTLKARDNEADGKQIVDHFDGYEFSVTSGARLINKEKKKSEMFTYVAQIKNLKTGLTAEALSDDKVESSNAVLKSAQVALRIYASGETLSKSELSMNCVHFKGDPKEKLELSH